MTTKYKICLTTYFDKRFEKLGKICLKSLKKYAEKHSYDVKLHNETSSVRPPSWNKILVIKKLFQEGYDFVFWVDADALFVRFDEDIADEIEEDKDFYLVKLKKNKELPNLGVYLIRNSSWSNEILDKKWAMEEYANRLWTDQAAFLDLFWFGWLSP